MWKIPIINVKSEIVTSEKQFFKQDKNYLNTW